MNNKKINKDLTKDDLQEIVMDATDAILGGVQKMFDDQNKKNELTFASKEDINELKTETSYIKDEFKSLKTDLSTTVSIGEFQKLKDKVDYHHPSN